MNLKSHSQECRPTQTPPLSLFIGHALSRMICHGLYRKRLVMTQVPFIMQLPESKFCRYALAVPSLEECAAWVNAIRAAIATGDQPDAALDRLSTLHLDVSSFLS